MKLKSLIALSIIITALVVSSVIIATRKDLTTISLLTENQIYYPGGELFLTVEIQSQRALENVDILIYGIANEAGQHLLKISERRNLKSGANTIIYLYNVPSSYSSVGIDPGTYPITIIVAYRNNVIATATRSVLLFSHVPPVVPSDNNIMLYFFWVEGCPDCAKEKRFLQDLEQEYPQLLIREFEVWKNLQNVDLLKWLLEAYGATVFAAPVTFISDDYFIGYLSDDTTGREIEEKVEYCLQAGSIDPLEKLEIPSLPESKRFRLPILGEVGTDVSLPLFTLIVAGLDSINPCTIWVLCFLLTLLIVYTGSRRKMFLVGGVFIATIAVIYFLFMAAWLNVFLIIGHANVLRIIIGAIAMVAGLINIKDFFGFRKGISLVVPKRFKPMLLKHMRSVAKSASVLPLIGIVVLALAVSLVEIPCTAGLPVIYTRVLTMQGLSGATYYSCLAMYCIIYTIPLLAIVGISTYITKGRKINEMQGRILKLAGGLLMLILGAIFMLKPELLMFG